MASEDIFAQLKTHLLLNLSRTQRKLGDFQEAEKCASQVVHYRPQCHEAWWARAKARSDLGRLQEALGDLREALKLAPDNLQLHAFSIQVKNQLEVAKNKTTTTTAAVCLPDDETAETDDAAADNSDEIHALPDDDDNAKKNDQASSNK